MNEHFSTYSQWIQKHLHGNALSQMSASEMFATPVKDQLSTVLMSFSGIRLNSKANT